MLSGKVGDKVDGLETIGSTYVALTLCMELDHIRNSI
jgi:hypothetical protein